MHDIDLRGKAAVLSVMEQTGAQYFSVYRAASTSRIPVFECMKKGSSAANTRAQFRKWAETIETTQGAPVVYEIVIFNSLEIDDDGEIKGRSKGTVGKVKFSFILAEAAAQHAAPQYSPSTQHENPRDQFERLFEMFENRMRENELLRRLEEIEMRLDDRDDDGGGGSTLDTIALLAGLLNQKQGPALAGPEVAEDRKQEIEKIRRAVAVLQKHDDHLGDDLLKLAQIAEQSPERFSMLIQTLRGL